MSYYLAAFSHIRPRFEMEQVALLSWTAQVHFAAALRAQNPISLQQIEERFLQIGTGKNKIRKRGFQIGDPFDVMGKKIYSTTAQTEGDSFTERMRFFDREASSICEQFYTPCTPLPTHLIHVTCTGYVAPSAAQKVISKLRARTIVTHAYHMGCYASVPAIRIAGALTSATSFVDIVHTEICSLHLHPLRHSTEQLVVESLFADGFIKYSVYRDAPTRPHLHVLSLLEEMVPDSLDSMSWRCEDVCHSMTLQKDVPVLIARSIEGCFSRLVERANLDEQKMRKEAYFAIHPRGPKVIENIRQCLSLQDKQIAHSSGVLQDFGNMSSATLPHIWERLLIDDQIPSQAYIASFAFGPGLCINGALFQKGGI